MIPSDWLTPDPQLWSSVYDVLVQRHRALRDQSVICPSKPLILAGAAFSTKEEIRSRWEEHIAWANANGCSEDVLRLLGEKPKQDGATKLAGAHGRPGEKEWWQDLGEAEDA